MRIISALALRFPPSGGDVDAHRARINALASDCADIEPNVLQEACKLATQQMRFLPTTAELRQFAKQVRDAQSGVGSEDWLQQRLRVFNLANMAEGSNVRAVVGKGDNIEMLRVGIPGERRRCDGKGGVVTPYWSEAKGDWIYPA
jgi:hypothetical protein